jgi:hypothetical protein
LLNAVCSLAQLTLLDAKTMANINNKDKQKVYNKMSEREGRFPGTSLPDSMNGIAFVAGAAFYFAV